MLCGECVESALWCETVLRRSSVGVFVSKLTLRKMNKSVETLIRLRNTTQFRKLVRYRNDSRE